MGKKERVNIRRRKKEKNSKSEGEREGKKVSKSE